LEIYEVKERSYFSNDGQEGNVLFLILIAVALFAALSYAVSTSMRSGGGNINSEVMSADIATMIQYTGALRQAVQRMIVSNDCSDETINVSSPNWANSGNYNNIKAPTDGSCDLFSPKGGNMIWQRPPQSSQAIGGIEYNIDGGVGVIDVGLNDCAKTELMAYTYVSRDMCLMINKKLGISNLGGEPPVQNSWNKSIPAPNHGSFGWGSGSWPSNYGCGVSLGYGSGETPELRAVTKGCFYVPGNAYYYYDVLLGR
jgi:hypothetical protein